MSSFNIRMKMKFICFCTYLQENAKKRITNKDAKERKTLKTQKKKQPRRIFSRTQTHSFQNEDVKKRKTQVLEERCKLGRCE